MASLWLTHSCITQPHSPVREAAGKRLSHRERKQRWRAGAGTWKRAGAVPPAVEHVTSSRDAHHGIACQFGLQRHYARIDSPARGRTTPAGRDRARWNSGRRVLLLLRRVDSGRPKSISPEGVVRKSVKCAPSWRHETLLIPLGDQSQSFRPTML